MLFNFVAYFVLFLNVSALQKPDKRELRQTDTPALLLYNDTICEWGTPCDPTYDWPLCPNSGPYPGVMCGKARNFTTNIFYSALFTHCQAFLAPLEACSHNFSLRSEAADVWALCFTNFLDYFWYTFSTTHSGPIAYDLLPGNFKKVNYVEVVDDSSCNKTDVAFRSLLLDVCSHEFDRVHMTNPSGFGNTLESSVEELLVCQIECAIHYTRCTQWPKAGENVTTCVKDIVDRVTWLDLFFITDNGSEPCLPVKDWIKHLIRYNVVAILATILLGSRRLLYWIFHKDPTAFQDKRIEWSKLSFAFSLAYHIGGTVGSAYLTLSHGRNSAALPADSSFRSDIGIGQIIYIWAMRPRTTAIIAIMGMIDRGYTGKAITAMIVNTLLCWIALVFTGNLYLKKESYSRPPDFSWKPSGWDVMKEGALLSMIGQALSLLATFLFIISVGWWRPKQPKTPDFQNQNQNRTSKWTRRHWVIYSMFAIVSLCLYIGSWMLWAGFLKVYVPLYCPSRTIKLIDLIWYIGPILSGIFGLLTDIYNFRLQG